MDNIPLNVRTYSQEDLLNPIQDNYHSHLPLLEINQNSFSSNQHLQPSSPIGGKISISNGKSEETFLKILNMQHNNLNNSWPNWIGSSNNRHFNAETVENILNNNSESGEIEDSQVFSYQKNLLATKQKENFESFLMENVLSKDNFSISNSFQLQNISDDRPISRYTHVPYNQSNIVPTYAKSNRKSLPNHSKYKLNPNQNNYWSSDRKNYPLRRSLPGYSHETLNIKESLIVDCSAGNGFIDTHCHIDFLFRKLKFYRSFTVFKRYCENRHKFHSNFQGCISIFCEPETYKKNSFWESLLVHDNIWSAFGCHPHFADTFTEESEKIMRYALNHEKVIALGEIGLDYSNKNLVTKDVQKSILEKQIKIAIEYNKPIVIHCRDAHSDCLQLCKKFIPSDHLVHRHCFTDKWDEACEWMAAFPNLKFGFTGLILRDDMFALRDVVRRLPINKILLETDAPYFKPHFIENITYSHPGMAIFVAKEIAVIKQSNIDEILIKVRKNTREIYNV